MPILNAKIILASAALFAAPASAKAMEPADALMGIIRMETAKQFCGLPYDQPALKELLSIVLPHVKLSAQEFTGSVQRAAGDWVPTCIRTAPCPVSVPVWVQYMGGMGNE